MGRRYFPKEIENNGYAKLLGANNVYYGRCESGEYVCKNVILPMMIFSGLERFLRMWYKCEEASGIDLKSFRIGRRCCHVIVMFMP